MAKEESMEQAKVRAGSKQSESRKQSMVKSLRQGETWKNKELTGN